MKRLIQQVTFFSKFMIFNAKVFERLRYLIILEQKHFLMLNIELNHTKYLHKTIL